MVLEEYLRCLCYPSGGMFVCIGAFRPTGRRNYIYNLATIACSQFKVTYLKGTEDNRLIPINFRDVYKMKNKEIYYICFRVCI
jgi:hypothetical protein